MPITLDNPGVFVDLLRADNSVSLAALVGTVAGYPSAEGGLELPIADAGDLQQKLQGVYDRIVREIDVDPDTLHHLLLESWLSDAVFPISSLFDLVRLLLLKIRVQMGLEQIGADDLERAGAADERPDAHGPGEEGPAHGDLVLGPDDPTCYRWPPRARAMAT